MRFKGKFLSICFLTIISFGIAKTVTVVKKIETTSAATSTVTNGNKRFNVFVHSDNANDVFKDGFKLFSSGLSDTKKDFDFDIPDNDIGESCSYPGCRKLVIGDNTWYVATVSLGTSFTTTWWETAIERHKESSYYNKNTLNHGKIWTSSGNTVQYWTGGINNQGFYYKIGLHTGLNLDNISYSLSKADSFLPSNPSTIAGYSFVGWYTDNTLQTPYNQSDLVGDINLYAKYTKCNYHFVNANNWSDVYAYAWSGSSGSEVKYLGDWPGTKISNISTYTYKDANASKVYSVLVDSKATKIIFNNGNSGGNQTVDIVFAEHDDKNAFIPVLSSNTVSVNSYKAVNTNVRIYENRGDSGFSTSTVWTNQKASTISFALPSAYNNNVCCGLYTLSSSGSAIAKFDGTTYHSAVPSIIDSDGNWIATSDVDLYAHWITSGTYLAGTFSNVSFETDGATAMTVSTRQGASLNEYQVILSLKAYDKFKVYYCDGTSIYWDNATNPSVDYDYNFEATIDGDKNCQVTTDGEYQIFFGTTNKSWYIHKTSQPYNGYYFVKNGDTSTANLISTIKLDSSKTQSGNDEYKATVTLAQGDKIRVFYQDKTKADVYDATLREGSLHTWTFTSGEGLLCPEAGTYSLFLIHSSTGWNQISIFLEGEQDAITYATYFNTCISGECNKTKTQGYLDSLGTQWQKLAGNKSEQEENKCWGDLSATSKSFFTTSQTNQTINECVTKYTYVLSKYNSSHPMVITDFMGLYTNKGVLTLPKSLGNYTVSVSADETQNSNTILIIVISSISIIALAGISLIIYKKKKHN